MKKLVLIILFLIIESPLLKAQYLLSFELDDTQGNNSCEIVYYVNDLQVLKVDELFSEINNAVFDANLKNNNSKLDSILMRIGIPIMDPGFSGIERKCSLIDNLDFDLNSIFSKPNIIYQFELKNDTIVLKFKLIKYYGELCVFRPSAQVWSDLPLFNMVGTIVSLELGPLDEKEKALLNYKD